MKQQLAVILVGSLILAVPLVGAADLAPTDRIDTTEASSASAFTHTVFCEEATATWCPYCPAMSNALYDVYTSGDYPFYFVAMIADKSQEAYDHLVDDYNLYGYPTSFFDGGREVIVGGYASEDPYREAIEAAGQQDVLNITLSLESSWAGETSIDVNVTVENSDVGLYEARLRAYVVEPTSRWNDNDGNPYHFGFLGWAFNQNISISYGNTFSETTRWDAAQYGYDSINPDNLMVIAVLFNAEIHEGYAEPPNGHPFDAHYVDQATAVTPVPDTTSPSVEISTPQAGSLYLLGREIMPLPFQSAIMVGQMPVIVDASDDISGIDSVAFYVDGSLVATDTDAPYEWNWNLTSLLQKHTIEAIASDGMENTASTQVDAIVLSL